MRQCTLLVLSFVMVSVVTADPYIELVPGFNRTRSNAMVRKITVPTLANLDYAAYNANPVRYAPEQFKPKVDKKIGTADMTFGKSVSNVCDSLQQTPLTSDECGAPVSWAPLQNRLWEALKTDALARLANGITSEKWGDLSIYKPYQEISAVYLHEDKGTTQIWVRIEFAPWVNFLQGVADNDNDGFKEVYAQLNTSEIADKLYSDIIQWIRTGYQGKKLTQSEIIDWAQVMASYWYPTLNTDIVDMTGQAVWPNALTEKNVKKTMRKVSIKNPLVVIRGKPFEKPIYNVYTIENTSEGAGNKPQAVSAAQQNATPVTAFDSAVSQNFTRNNTEFDREVGTYGDYASWADKNGQFYLGLKKLLGTVPSDQMAIQGKGNWLFFRKSFDYMLGGDLTQQASDKNPLQHLIDFKNYLKSHNIGLLFIAVPNKEEVYYDNIPNDATATTAPYVNPYSRKILKDLQANGIEVIDLLPDFLKAKEQDYTAKDPVYQRQDTHWTNRGLQIAADKIASRIKEYSWYNDLPKTKYITIDTTFERQGDIVDKLPEQERLKYQPAMLSANQVRTADNVPYKGAASDPVLLIGDSFTGVFELIDCKSAGLGSQIAYRTGIPVDIITSWGGGPLVRQKAMRARENYLGIKKLVIYVMVSRDLYNYSQSWEPFPEKK